MRRSRYELKMLHGHGLSLQDQRQARIGRDILIAIITTSHIQVCLLPQQGHPRKRTGSKPQNLPTAGYSQPYP